MTGRNLRPDTGREISGLKRRVSDLERMLDRIRRGATPGAVAPPLPPFASITDTVNAINASCPTGFGAGLAVYGANGDVIVDPTGTIAIDADNPWTFRITGPGWFEVGATVRFHEAAGEGGRAVGAIRNDVDPVEFSVFQMTSRAPGASTIASGSRMVWCDQARWTVWFAQTSGVDFDIHIRSYWARQVTDARPPAEAGSM